MTITNQAKPSPSVSNVSKVSIGETWTTITTTWATEIRTWLAVSQLITNVVRTEVESLVTEALDYLMTEDDDFLTTGVNQITNIAKP